MKDLARFSLLLIVCVVIASCSEYRKALRSADMQYKYDVAHDYFKKKKYAKALPLLDELYIQYRGTEKGERIAFLLAKCEYGIKDYISAGYHFGQFHKDFPGSGYAEEAQFLSAFCSYKMSPKFSLDQTDTYKAIRSFQLFAIQYPESSRMDSCNQLLDELRYKIELKEYKTAKLYFKRETFRAATVSLNNFNTKYPNSRYKEETWFLWLKSSYLLAVNSVEEKKSDRIEAAKKAYSTFADRFPQSKHSKEAVEMVEDLERLTETELKES